ncbi:MAG: tetratricopeptide repeat protein [Flavobacteriales bacterium]|nr:tetratricopeptide repeat protein [Flavobacteriales bacterium]
MLESTNEVKEIKSFIFNNLGLVFGQMEQFEESVLYFNKALDLKKDLPGDNKLSIYRTINNLALSYNNSGDHEVAIKNYNIILDDKKTISERPDFYALVLDNYANTLFLSKNYERLPDLYLKALKICDSLGDNSAKYNSIVINQHLAEYYHTFNQKDSAKYYAYRAKNISEEYHNDDLLKSLLLLSKIEDDRTAVKFYNAYIKLNDSLVKVERTTRNKFARIRFETKEIEQKNIQIAREKLWLTIISIIILTSAILIYIIINQRSKNKELQFVQKQQETNEEIYNLMLTQQEKIEEARILEKKNISQELHDGVLGRLFGTRLSLDSLNMATSAEAIETRNRYIQDLQKIENDIRKVSHELNTDFISGSGFVDIIKSLLETQTKAYKLNYKFDYDDSINWEDLTNKNKIHVYRILQESIHNIFKHANANIIKIGIQLKNNVILVSIKDDGSGFDVNKAKSGIGLKNINSRVEEINGQLSIESVKDVGTTVKIRVPI